MQFHCTSDWFEKYEVLWFPYSLIERNKNYLRESLKRALIRHMRSKTVYLLQLHTCSSY
jgi:hypothetical protein